MMIESWTVSFPEASSRIERLHRLVEHDYFGWLMGPAHIGRIRPLARVIQSDLAAYDFGQAPEDDLFGDLLAALAQRTQRVLLGQERTPKIIADAMAEALFERLEDHVAPRFVDMCCGSGSMLVANDRKGSSSALPRWRWSQVLLSISST